MEFVESLKNGGKLVSYNGYLYRRDKEYKTTINWRCTEKGCKGRLITSAVSSTDEIPCVRGEHCHLPNPCASARFYFALHIWIIAKQV